MTGPTREDEDYEAAQDRFIEAIEDAGYEGVDLTAALDDLGAHYGVVVVGDLLRRAERTHEAGREAAIEEGND